MTRPPPTSRSRAARDALAAVILAAFEVPASAAALDDLSALLAGTGTAVDRARAARLGALSGLVRVDGQGTLRRAALLPARRAEQQAIAARVRCARAALAAYRARSPALPGRLGIAAALLGAGLFFEVHEVLEQRWRTLTGVRRRFYQGLIQLAVALHHLAEGSPASAARLFAASRDKLAPLAPSFDAVDVATLLAGTEAWERWAARGGGWPDEIELPLLRATGCGAARRRGRE